MVILGKMSRIRKLTSNFDECHNSTLSYYLANIQRVQILQSRDIIS